MGLFNDNFSCSHYTASNVSTATEEWTGGCIQGSGCALISFTALASAWYDSKTITHTHTHTHTHTGQHSWCSSWESNQTLHEHNSDPQSLEQTCMVSECHIYRLNSVCCHVYRLNTAWCHIYWLNSVCCHIYWLITVTSTGSTLLSHLLAQHCCHIYWLNTVCCHIYWLNTVCCHIYWLNSVRCHIHWLNTVLRHIY